MADWLKKHKKIKVEIGVHYDSEQLKYRSFSCFSCDRADAIRGYLIEAGVKPKQLIAKGYGSSQPIIACDPCTKEEYMTNSRLEVKVMEVQ